MTAARVVKNSFKYNTLYYNQDKDYNTVFSKSPGEESVRKLSLLLLKFAVPVIYFVVVELVPYRGGNEFGTGP